MSWFQSIFRTTAGAPTAFKDSKAANRRWAAYDKFHHTFSTDMWQRKVTERRDAKTGAATADHVRTFAWLSAEEAGHR